ncbi:hypothetical protein IE4803_PC00318 (plasmid) [Rhizobium etli bv. phaseoli str. IE4803]|nr:hypothetical protein IE4803_PC00318 [Rhizobium etli bv. phaseoli str. IE4803]
MAAATAARYTVIRSASSQGRSKRRPGVKPGLPAFDGKARLYPFRLAPAPHPAAATFSPPAGRREDAANSPFPVTLSQGKSPRPVYGKRVRVRGSHEVRTGQPRHKPGFHLIPLRSKQAAAAPSQ